MTSARNVCGRICVESTERYSEAGEIEQSSRWSSVDRQSSVMELVQAVALRRAHGAFQLARWSVLAGAPFLRHSSAPNRTPPNATRGTFGTVLALISPGITGH